MDASFEVAVEVTKDYLLVRVTGPYSPKLLAGTIKRVGERVAREHLSKILADFRGLTGVMQVSELHEFGEMIPRMLPKGCSIALVVTDLGDEDHRFLETVARNRGALLRIFATFEDAELWLRGPVG